ncbi:hypothetical protein KDW99_01550 [Marinomonas rhizomae]|nr:hypothetical protein KDW99_01550 [Marinomonas rhizomae]
MAHCTPRKCFQADSDAKLIRGVLVAILSLANGRCNRWS